MTSRTMLTLGALTILAAVGPAGCVSEAPGPLAMNDQELEAWEIRLVEFRIDKNEAFMDSTQTALRVEDLPGFEGLNYYYPEKGLRYRLPLEPVTGGRTVELTKRKGNTVPYVLKGKVTFAYEGKNHTLSVLGPADPKDGDYLWLPFYDATSGEETYGGGRYLDLELAADGTVEVDFNFAYNPLCDYNPEKYNCTLPPAENRLPFAVRAGEKLFRAHE
ncbi:MAG: DUF1684 domain-containing protein [bacterium]|nr:DUF1684 domain-containing protein [bacterium]